MELFLSFRSFKSGKKVTESFFQWSRFFKLSYDAHISWNNIFSASSHWISWLYILISMTKDAEHIWVNTVRVTFLLHQ